MDTEDKKNKSETALREERILEFWHDNKIFDKSLAQTKGKKEFIFYEGPPTANGKPGIHHLEARAFKDAIPRYKTMRGYHVRRKGGWDTHGLPVELQVEKKLGLNSKKAIEEYGIAKFNQECKESVWEYLEIWNKFTRRIGFWVDQENPYVTYHNDYIESLWSIVKKVNEQKLLYKDYKVVPWCPRCGTVLSSHELAQGYEDVKDLSIYAKFKVKGQENTYILAWTTTPWTLPGNVALAVGEEIDYVKVENNLADIKNLDIEEKVGNQNIKYKEKIIVAKNILEPYKKGEYYYWGGGNFKVIAEFKGKDLIGIEYEPLYPYLKEQLEKKKESTNKMFKVYTASFVNTNDGTGIVHTAVMYGQDDFELGTKIGLPKHHLVGLDGKFLPGTGFLEGRFVKDEEVAVDIIKDLAHRGLLFAKEKYEHSYPHCWRCKTPLIYYARDSWYIKMSDPAVKAKLIEENKTINWEPAHIRDGRFGEWLREIKDWAISRERYWGTPLPVWECAACKKREVIGDIEELKKRSGGSVPQNEKGDLDLHRPYIDEISLTCDCGSKLARVKEVMDVWFDSGAMPFAQDHYPFENKNWVDGAGYPADFISEAIDQTRGWFYTLHAIGVLMGRGKAFKNVICLGHLMDANGKKMSKSLGNIVDPWQMIEKYGVDTLRLWMYSVNQPGESKNFDEKTVMQLSQQVFGLLYNVLFFYELYRTEELETNERPKSQNVLDVWILGRLHELTALMTKSMDNYKLLEPVRALRDFIGDLSTWYLRRSRERIKSSSASDSAKATTGKQGSGRIRDGDSAKQTLYYVLKTLSKLLAPFAPFAAEDIWQRLRKAGDEESVHLASWPSTDIMGKIRVVLEKGRVKKIILDMKTVRNIVSAGLKERQTQNLPVKQPLRQIKIKITLPKNFQHIIAEELNIKKIKEDKNLKTELELDTELTPELKEEGNYRELVRALQDLRKNVGLTPSDFVTLSVATDTRGKELIRKFETELKKTVLVSEIKFTDNDGEEIQAGDLDFRIEISKP